MDRKTVTITYRIALALWLSVGSSLLQAHGYWPAKHGGIMNDGETSFELVARDRQVVLYLEDHGTPIPTAGATGTFKLTRKGVEQLFDLHATGDNRLQARIAAKLLPGDQIVARVQLGSGSIVVGRFVLP